MNNYKVAVIPGDGIGVDVINAAWQVLELSAKKHHFSLQAEWFPWSCDYYLEHGEMMPKDGIDRLRQFKAILLGAVGWPQRVPDNVSLHGLLLPIRKQFDLFANVRPHRLLPGVRGPLREENFDILCIRENTEGEYSGAGGRIHQGTPQEVAVETSIFTRQGVERILRFGFEAARRRSGRLASVTKSNAQKYTMVMWDEITEEIALQYPDVKVTRYHIDAIAARFVMQPASLDVVVASNLFGDILTDLGAAIQGGLGYAASANLNPDPTMPSMFEPVHGSAPDIAGQNIANPIAAIWSGALMLEHLGEKAAAQGIMQALQRVTAEVPLHQTPTTAEITAAVLRLI
ncbi:tartrate dehydrogenase [Pantoea sp. B65]|uniref:tartrate dehydrogenase n=1 Tax=Pantoea sp. B65 TaxID=2813359 RepID=UPI0039B6C7A9